MFMKLKKEAEKMMMESAALANSLGYQVAEENIRKYLEAFRKKEMMIVVAGEARRGKSSLLNALLNEKTAIFPVDVNVCTNVVTVLRYGATEKIEVYLEDEKEQDGYRVENISREQLVDYVSEKGNTNNYKRVKMVNAAVPNELLKEGIVFVDTPGVGSLNIEHAETTYGFLPNADLLLFVSDADSGLTESELNFLKRGYSYCSRVIFPLTKKDLNNQYPVILSDNCRKISETLGISEEQIHMIPVSSLAKLNFLESGRRAMYINSNFAELEGCIWNEVAKNRGEVLLLPYLNGAKQEIEKMLDNVIAQKQTLGDTALQDLLDEYKTLVSGLKQLQIDGASWKNDLNLCFTLLQTEINAARIDIEQSAKALIDESAFVLGTKICKEEVYREVFSAVNDEIATGLINIRNMISEEMEKKMESLEEQMELGMESNESLLAKLGFTPKETEEITFRNKKFSDKVITKGRIISMDAVGGTMIGVIIGGAVGMFGGPIGVELGAWAGGKIGALVGGAKGCVDSLGKYDQMDVNTVVKELNKYVVSTMQDINKMLTTTMVLLKDEVIRSFDAKLKIRISELQENQAMLKQNIALTENEIPKRRAELKQQADRLAEVQKQLAEMEEKVLLLSAEEKKPVEEDPKTEEPDEKESAEKKEPETYAFL